MSEDHTVDGPQCAAKINRHGWYRFVGLYLALSVLLATTPVRHDLGHSEPDVVERAYRALNRALGSLSIRVLRSATR
jgi:hypothetical protein